MGRALVLAVAILGWVEAEDVWVEAAAPVMARTTTKARTMFFMSYPFGPCFLNVQN
jgi:hypothetical protein